MKSFRSSWAFISIFFFWVLHILGFSFTPITGRSRQWDLLLSLCGFTRYPDVTRSSETFSFHFFQSRIQVSILLFNQGIQFMLPAQKSSELTTNRICITSMEVISEMLGLWMESYISRYRVFFLPLKLRIVSPTGSRLIKTRGTLTLTRAGRPATGMTVKEVPIISRKSACLKSCNQL